MRTGDTQVAEQRERFARDGYVEFRLRAWKVVVHLLMFVGIVVGLVGLAYSLGPMLELWWPW